MKKVIEIITVGMLLIAALPACTAIQMQPPKSAETEGPVDNMQNPASVYCEQNGNTLLIQTAADGSQSGVCVFPDGSTCDEWAFYKGECSPTMKPTSGSIPTVDPTLSLASGGYMSPGASEPFSDWWGIIKSTEPGSQYDDLFERQDLGGAIYFGIDSLDPAVKAQIEALRDTGQIVHLSGTLLSNVPDYNGSQVLVDSLVVE
jgi:putative hemolysin